jgi:hypothetical protein
MNEGRTVHEFTFRPENTGGTRTEPFGKPYVASGSDFRHAAEVLVRHHKELAGRIMGVWYKGSPQGPGDKPLARGEFIGFLRVE